MPEAGSDDAARPWQRHLMLGVAALVGLHSLILALWLSPANPVRDSVGDTALNSYVMPYFDQGWAELDPRLQRVDEAFRIRAQIVVAGTKKPRFTPWIDLTKAESGPLRHDVDPARVHVMARRLATGLNAAMFNLAPAQRKLVRDSFVDRPISSLTQSMQAAGADRPVQAYLSYDQMATEFASLYAKARYPDDTILGVQYLVGRRTVPQHADRDDKSLKDVGYLWFAFGFRRAYKGSYESQVAFDSYVKK